VFKVHSVTQKNIKFGHFKLFGTVYSKTDAVLDDTSFLRHEVLDM